LSNSSSRIAHAPIIAVETHLYAHAETEKRSAVSHHGLLDPRPRGYSHPRPSSRLPSQGSSFSCPLCPPSQRQAHADLLPSLFPLSQFKKLLAPGKIGQTLCLGNLTDKPTYDYLRSITPDLKIVKGRHDVEATSLPLTQVVTHGAIRIGFLEGFTLVSSEPDLLLAEANRLDVDVLCWGGTHRFDAFEYMDKFFVNPGSATGAFHTAFGLEAEEPTPSFCLMDV
jgi:putative phosphoesterase